MREAVAVAIALVILGAVVFWTGVVREGGLGWLWPGTPTDTAEPQAIEL